MHSTVYMSCYEEYAEDVMLNVDCLSGIVSWTYASGVVLVTVEYSCGNSTRTQVGVDIRVCNNVHIRYVCTNILYMSAI